MTSAKELRYAMRILEDHEHRAKHLIFTSVTHKSVYQCSCGALGNIHSAMAVCPCGNLLSAPVQQTFAPSMTCAKCGKLCEILCCGGRVWVWAS